MWVFEPLKVL